MKKAAAPAAVALALALLFALAARGDALVVYCSHDAVFADAILKRFEIETGTRVAVRYDTEATKSLGLVEAILAERERPRCDVFWNNELLGTLDLAEKGLLEPYKGTGWSRIPAAQKDPDGRWTGFAARLRVRIENRGMRSPGEGGTSEDRGGYSQVAIAKPLYGTTLTHYAVLWDRWGPERLKAWHGELRRGGVREMRGNAAVKDAVASGACALGYTDTDDYFEAKDAGMPVAIRPVRVGDAWIPVSMPPAPAPRDEGATICIPNTVAIMHATKRLAAARRLADHLLSGETELALARSKSRQIPLGPVKDSDLPEEVRELRAWAKDAVPLGGLLQARNECVAWLKSGAGE